LASGQQYQLKFDKNYTIEFDRAGGFGTAKYSLRDGNFEFFVGDKGWDLKKTQPAADSSPQLQQSLPENTLPRN
jgi:hypothetical protein